MVIQFPLGYLGSFQFIYANFPFIHFHLRFGCWTTGSWRRAVDCPCPSNPNNSAKYQNLIETQA